MHPLYLSISLSLFLTLPCKVCPLLEDLLQEHLGANDTHKVGLWNCKKEEQNCCVEGKRNMKKKKRKKKTLVQ